MSSSKRTSSKKEGKRTSVFERLGTSAKTQQNKEVFGSSGSEWPEICRTFAKTGICKFGASCKYQHVTGKSREEEESSDNKGEYWKDKGNVKKHKSKISEVNLMRPRTIPANQDMENVSSDDSSSFIGYKEWKKKKEKEKMMDFQEVLLLEQQRQKLQQELALELARENDTDVENPPVIPPKKVKESSMTSESSSSYSSSTSSSSSGSSSTSSSSSSDSDSDSPPVKRKKKIAKKQRELPKKKADHKSRQDKTQMETKKKSKPVSFDHAFKKKKAYKDEKKILSKDKKMSKSEILSSPEPKKKSKSSSHKHKYATQESVKVNKHGKKLGVTPPSGKKTKKAKEKHKLLERISVTPVRGPELKAHGKQKHTSKESGSHVKSSGQDKDAKSRLVTKKKDKRKSFSSSPERKSRKKLKPSPHEEKIEHRKGQQFMKARSASSESHSSQSRDRRSDDKNKEKRRELTPSSKKEKLKKKKALSQETSIKHRLNDDKIDTQEVYEKKMSRTDFQRGEKMHEKEKHDRYSPGKSRPAKDDKEREHHPPGRRDPRDLHRDISSDANRTASRYDQRDRHLDEKGGYNDHDKYQEHPDYSFSDRGRKDYQRPESQRGYSHERTDHRGDYGRYDKNDDHGVSEWDYRSLPLDNRSRHSEDRHASSRDDHRGHSLTHLPPDDRRTQPRDDIRVPPVTERDRRVPPRGSRRGPAPDDRRNASGDDRRGPTLFDRRGFPIGERKSLLPDEYRDPHPLTERMDDRRGPNYETRLINRHGDPYGPSIPMPLPVDDRYGPVPLLRGELSKPRERPARYERELFDDRRELFDERERQDNRGRPRDDTVQYEQPEMPRRRGGRSRGKGFGNRYDDRMDQEPEGSESYPDYRDRDFNKYRDNRKRPRDDDKSPYGAPPGKRYREDAWNEEEHWQREGSTREQVGERKRETETDRRKEDYSSRRHDDASPRNEGSEDSKHREKISGDDSRNKQSSRERDYRRKHDDSPRVSTDEPTEEHKDIPLEHECSDLALPDDDLLDADIKLPPGEDLIGEAFSDVSEENFADDIDKLSEGVNLAVAEAEREVASHLSPRVGEGEQIASVLSTESAEPDEIKGHVEEPLDDKTEATAVIESEMEPISDDELENIFREDDEQKKEEEVENFVPQPKATDLLDVDWASLAQDPRPNLSVSVSARKRFTLANIISRVGISKQFAGEELVDKLKAACVKELQENGNPDAKFELHSDVALFHVKAELQKKQRDVAISDIGPNRKALCARSDIEIRRRLCNLSDKIQDQSYTTQTVDSELYAQHLALFREHLTTMAKASSGIIPVETSS